MMILDGYGNIFKILSIPHQIIFIKIHILSIKKHKLFIKYNSQKFTKLETHKSTTDVLLWNTSEAMKITQ